MGLSDALVNWRTVALKEGVNDLAYALYASDATAKPEGLINLGGGPSGERHRHAAAQHLVPPRDHFDGSMQRLFLNGVQIGSLAASGSLMQTIGALRIGGNSVWGEFFSGALDDMRIYNRALSTTEIQTDMDTPVAPPPADTTLPDVAISTPVTARPCPARWAWWQRPPTTSAWPACSSCSTALTSARGDRGAIHRHLGHEGRRRTAPTR